MRKNHAHLVMILDRSYSMTSMRDAVLEGFSQFIADQKDQEGTATFTLVQFNTHYEIVHDEIELESVAELTHETFQPQGGTALLDAIGRTLSDYKEKYDNSPEDEKPERVLFAIVTDGEERDSTQYGRETIFGMLDQVQEDHNWGVTFIGANQDAIAEGRNIGVRIGSSLSFDATDATAVAAFSSLSKGVSSYRQTGEAVAYSAEDRASTKAAGPVPDVKSDEDLVV